MTKWLIILMLMLPIAYATVECQWSADNATDWRNITNIETNYKEGLQHGLQQDTEYYIRCKNDSTSYGYLSQRTKEGVDNMFLIPILLIPLGLCFLFIYWGNSLSEEHAALAWFMRMLSLVMIFVLFVGAHIVLEQYPKYAALTAMFDIGTLGTIFFAVGLIFATWFIYRIFKAFKMKKQDDFEKGVLR